MQSSPSFLLAILSCQTKTLFSSLPPFSYSTSSPSANSIGSAYRIYILNLPQPPPWSKVLFSCLDSCKRLLTILLYFYWVLFNIHMSEQFFKNLSQVKSSLYLKSICAFLSYLEWNPDNSSWLRASSYLFRCQAHILDPHQVPCCSLNSLSVFSGPLHMLLPLHRMFYLRNTPPHVAIGHC